MAINTLEAIIGKVRQLTSSPNSNQLSDASIIDAVNSFYLYDFPAEFRSLSLRDTYTFNTIQGIDTYPFDRDHWMELLPPAYVAKREVRIFYEPYQFYYFNFNSDNHWQKEETIGTGDGSTANFTATLQTTPILRSINNNPIVDTQTSNTGVFPNGFPVAYNQSNISRIQNILITANITNGQTLHVTDDGAGNLIGDVDAGGTNTIDYSTGAVDVTFSQTITNDEDVVILYSPVSLNIPLAIMFYQNQVILRPVPDKGYTVEISGYRTPSQALLGSTSTSSPDLSGRPEILEWWETIAFGAAKKIYENRLDGDGIAMMDKGLAERYELNEVRTYAKIGSRQIPSIYRDQLENQSGNNPFGIGAIE